MAARKTKSRTKKQSKTKVRAKGKKLVLKAGKDKIVMGGPGLSAFRSMMGF